MEAGPWLPYSCAHSGMSGDGDPAVDEGGYRNVGKQAGELDNRGTIVG